MALEKDAAQKEFEDKLAAKDPDTLVAEMTQALEQANESTQSFVAKRTDRWYPLFHIATPGGWLNDPNGLCYYQGQYHVYFQHHPYSTQWGPMHWGHATSPDLVHWQQHPIVMAPSIEGDKDGVFSGSALVRSDESGEDSELWVYYTGHRWRNGVDGEAGNLQVQCLATSKDGFHFEKRGTLIDCPKDFLDFRDPKVWVQDGQGFMVLGARTLDDRGQIWLYRSTDLVDWQFDRVLFEDPTPEVFMPECPDFFPLGDHWVLAYSPIGLPGDGYRYQNLNSVVCVVGDWQPGSDFVPLGECQPVDWGQNYYAPQSFLDPAGRRIQFGWLSTFTAPPTCQVEDAWCGQLTVPRMLDLTDDYRVRARPVPELADLYCGQLVFANGTLNRTEQGEQLTLPANEPVIAQLKEQASDPDCGLSLSFTLNLSQLAAERVYLSLDCGQDQPRTALRWGYDRLAHTVFVERGPGAKGEKSYRAIPLAELGIDRRADQVKIAALVDRSSIEVFVQDGLGTLTSTFYPESPVNSVSILSEVVAADLEQFSADRVGQM